MYTLISLSIITLISCKKHPVTPQTELLKLPLATQTGANTFGCLVNGVAFLPSGSSFSGPIKQCDYIYTAGGYYFLASGTNRDDKTILKDIIVAADSSVIKEGQTLKFDTRISGHAYASYTLYSTNGNINAYTTTESISGQFL